MQATGAVAAALVLAALLLDEGEVVTLITYGEGRSYQTQLWIVRLGGREHLRAGSSGARWLARLRVRPEVGLRRAEKSDAKARAYRARPSDEDGLRDRVNRAMAAKYGLADRLWGLLSDRRRAVPVVLERVSIDIRAAGHPGDGRGDSP